MSYKDLHIFIHILFQMQDRCKFSILLLLEMHYVFCSSCSLRPLEEREIVRLSRSRWTESGILQTGAGTSSRCLHSLLIPLKEAVGCRDREGWGMGRGGVGGEWERISYSEHATQTQHRQQTVKDTHINHIFLTVSMDSEVKKKKIIKLRPWLLVRSLF